MKRIRVVYRGAFILLLLITLVSDAQLPVEKQYWKKIAVGLQVGEFKAPQKSISGDSKITIIKINPNYYSFKLLCAKEHGLAAMTVKDWCHKFELIGGVNAGMFQTDFLSNVGYMKNVNHINNPRISSKYLSVFAFNPVNQNNSPAQIFDTDEEKINDVIKNYNTVIQNLRLIKRPGKNRWSKQSKMWSEAALGEDRQGNILLIFCRSPYSMHDFNNNLLKLPIDIVCAQHLEGGPEASLYFRYKGIEIEKCGSFETFFNENDQNNSAWNVPNILGFVKK
jgi:hypothetical protein